MVNGVMVANQLTGCHYRNHPMLNLSKTRSRSQIKRTKGKTLATKRKFKSHSDETKVYHQKRSSAQVLSFAQEKRQERLANETPSEQAMEILLREWGIAFEREAIFLNGDRFILIDFLLRTNNLYYAVEIDGETHRRQAGYDAGRDRWLEKTHNIKTIRITNQQVIRKPDEVRRLIQSEMNVK